MGVASQAYLRAGKGVVLGAVFLGEYITPVIWFGYNSNSWCRGDQHAHSYKVIELQHINLPTYFTKHPLNYGIKHTTTLFA